MSLQSLLSLCQCDGIKICPFCLILTAVCFVTALAVATRLLFKRKSKKL